VGTSAEKRTHSRRIPIRVEVREYGIAEDGDLHASVTPPERRSHFTIQSCGPR
jgi:hypothetical protein